MKKVISFSLWGNNPKYLIGAVKNAEIARDLFPDWICRFYIPDIESMISEGGVGLSVIHYLAGADNCDLIQTNQFGDWRGMFWRFRAMSDPECDIMLSRDCDSRLSLREKLAVEEWLKSNKGFHVMHTHYHHSVPILGGMFGVKDGVIPNMNQLIDEWLSRKLDNNGNYWQIDQQFLAQVIWPIVKDNTLNHADFHTNIWPGQPFPTPIEPGHFIGATYDEDDNIDQQQLRQLYG